VATVDGLSDEEFELALVASGAADCRCVVAVTWGFGIEIGPGWWSDVNPRRNSGGWC
jgi:hypothetical protein